MNLPRSPTFQPLLTVIGALFILAGVMGWLWSNPLQVETLTDLGLLRGSVNVVLAAVGGSIVPLLYTWFVAGRSDPTLTGRGLAAGVIGGLAVAPFVQPGPALLTGVLAGATVPFVTYIVDHLLNLDDATGVIVTSGAPALLGLLLVGVFADGATGAGWQLLGAANYLGVAGQGVSGLLVAGGFQPDFPGQLQAQVIGVVAFDLVGVRQRALGVRAAGPALAPPPAQRPAPRAAARHVGRAVDRARSGQARSSAALALVPLGEKPATRRSA